jgi:hypothetical protein
MFRKLTCHKLLLGSALMLLMSGGYAAAQEAVNARVGSHDTYGRLVFDWPSAVTYNVNQQGDNIEIQFSRSGQMNLTPARDPNIQSIQQVQGGSQPLVVSVKAAPNRELRHFTIGNRVIVDLIDKNPPAKSEPPKPAATANEKSSKDVAKKEAAPPAAANTKADASKAASSKEKNESVNTPALNEAKEKTVATKDEAPKTQTIAPPPSTKSEKVIDASQLAVTADSQKAKAAEQQDKIETAVADKLKGSDNVVVQTSEEIRAEAVASAERARAEAAVAPRETTISITSTEAMGVAAFERANRLWIVIDRPNFRIAPQITGADKDQFPAFKRMEIPDATAFFTDLPADGGPYLYGEGSGLIWRVVQSNRERLGNAVLPVRHFEGVDAISGPTVQWPLKNITNIISLNDPIIGDVIKVATVTESNQNGGAARNFVEFNTLQSPIGLAIIPKVDDLKIEHNAKGVSVFANEGLSLSNVRDTKSQRIREHVQDVMASADPEAKHIFNFDRWRMGGLEELADNQTIVLGGMANKDKNGRVQDALSLAKMNIANDRGQEALGFLNYAVQELPDLDKAPEFIALRGAAEALAGKYELAWEDLNNPILSNYEEIKYWRAYTLAWLGDWQQSASVLPSDITTLMTYPRALLEKLAIKLAEIHLRKNEVAKAELVLGALERDKNTLKPWTKAGLDYLTGQAARQKGNPEITYKLWQPLVTGDDRFYRARSGLALTLLELEDKNIDYNEAINRLEALRFAWRGDEIEAQTNFTLGRLYIENGNYLKGFGILRDATEISPHADINNDIHSYMVKNFVDIVGNKEGITPEDAVMLYEEFKDLTPDNEEGRAMVRKLAERLVDADLLTRAAAIMQHQIDFRIAGEEQAKVSMRAAAIYLLDKDPKPALAALDKAKIYYDSLNTDEGRAQSLSADLMKARAYSQMNQPQQALALLNSYPQTPEINRLRADIAWNAGSWADAAEAINDLILDEAITPDKALSDAQADLILNRAVALNLSGNRVALANFQKRFGDTMSGSSRARLFDVVTRQRKTNIIADRSTIENIVSEVDMFKGFLENYKSHNEKKK